MKYANTSHEEIYAMSFSIVVTFPQIMLKTFIRALDKVIYMSMIINENNNGYVNNW